jgi:glycine dehydrogenase subunit 1
MSHPYISSGDQDRESMLKQLGFKNFDQLFQHIPIQSSDFDIQKGLSEWETAHEAQSLSQKNASTHDAYSFLGAGVYDHWYPSVVDYLVSRGEFLTAYTPYQPELSQGNLQIIYEFQTMLSRLYGMEICNASVYDGAHALVECVLMALRIKRLETASILVTQSIHPEYLTVLKTYLKGFSNIDIICAPLDSFTGQTLWEKSHLSEKPIAAVVGQYPNFMGVLDDMDPMTHFAKSKDALSILVNNEPFAFGIHEPPGLFDVDMVAAELQAIGNPIGFGGPHIGAVLTRKSFIRQLPGRLVGKTKTLVGDRDAYTLTLSTREQHIRREKATSNICTNQGLMVNRVVATLCLLGNEGFKTVAQQNYRGAHLAFETWRQYANPIFPKAQFFNEFAFHLTPELQKTVEALRKDKIYWGVVSHDLPEPKVHSKDYVLCCVTEKRLPREIQAVEIALKSRG